jgi:2-phosphoglycerate kinase
MIYLIGGSPRSGKSILSRKLSKKLNIPYISTDNLKFVVMPYFKGKEKLKCFPIEKMLDFAAFDKYYENYTGQEMLSANITEAKSMWPGIKSLILYLRACEMDYIIEGVHLLPNLLTRLSNDKNIKVVFLAKSNEVKILNGLLRNKNNNDWLVDNVKNKKTISIAAKSLCDYGKYFNMESKKYGFRCINTEDNFLDKIQKASDYLRA